MECCKLQNLEKSYKFHMICEKFSIIIFDFTIHTLHNKQYNLALQNFSLRTLNHETFLLKHFCGLCHVHTHTSLSFFTSLVGTILHTAYWTPLVSVFSTLVDTACCAPLAVV